MTVEQRDSPPPHAERFDAHGVQVGHGAGHDPLVTLCPHGPCIAVGRGLLPAGRDHLAAGLRVALPA